MATSQDFVNWICGPALDSDFLLYLLIASRDYIRSLSSGAVHKTVYMPTVKEFRVCMPPVAEQRRIAGILKEQLSAVERARAAAQAQLDAAQALPAAYLREVFESAEAKDWSKCELGDVCQIQLGKMLSPKSKKGKRPVPYLRNANVQWNRFDLGELAEMDFTEEQEEKFSLRSGDLLVCEGGEPGRAAVWHGQIPRCCYQKALHRLRAMTDGAVNMSFIKHRLWHGASIGEFAGSNTQTTIAHLPAVRLRKLVIRLPAPVRQDELADLLDQKVLAAEETIFRCKALIRTIGEVPAALLRAAFQGQL